MVVVIYPDSLQTNSAHKVKYAILLSIVYLQGKSTAANILPEQIDLQSYTWSLGGTTTCIYSTSCCVYSLTRVDLDCDYLHTPCLYICYIIGLHSVHSKHCEAGTLETTIINSAVGAAGSHSV